MLADASEICSKAFFSGLEPDPILTVSEWADRYRKLSQEASAEPGQWKTERTPYLKDIMDALSPSSPYKEVVFIKGSQVGGTECGNNWIGYVIDYAPGPMLAVQPTVDLAKRLSDQRLEPFLRESPRLSEKVKDSKTRNSKNNTLRKKFPGGVLLITGANSAVGLRSMPARYIFLDEVDGYPLNLDGEGDPVTLATARARTFSRNKKVFQVSSPTIDGLSRIDNAYQGTDQRKYYVPCPYCKELQTIKWANIQWPKGEFEKVVLKCEHCKKDIEEYHKKWMLANGKWIAECPEKINSRKIGFHISALYSPLGWYSWREAAEQWEDAQKDSEKLKSFVNTVLGETWKEKGEAPEYKRLYERRELYEIGIIPNGGLFLTAGVDVQKDRLECEIVAWGRNKESWSVDYRILQGDTSAKEVWDKLEILLNEDFAHEKSGVCLKIKLMAIDTGFNTQHVYNFCRKFPTSQVIAVKGRDNLPLMIGRPSSVDVKSSGRTIRRGLKLWPVGTNLVKSEIYGFLRQDSPSPDESYPHGYCHFPQYDEEYFKQLTAEETIIKVSRGYKTHVWQKTRDRNEALDARVYARAAAANCGIDRYKEEHWKRLEFEIGVASQNQKSDNKKKISEIKRRQSTFWND